MKNLILSLVIVFLAGCESTPDKESRCSSYAAAYQAYQAISAQREPSKDEIMAAQAAAAFLAMYCNWSAPVAAGRELSSDQYGVPVIAPRK